MSDPNHLASDPVGTPNTDAAVWRTGATSTEVVYVEFARDQERTIVDLIKALTHAKQWLEGWASAEPELAYIEKAIQKATQP